MLEGQLGINRGPGCGIDVQREHILGWREQQRPLDSIYGRRKANYTGNPQKGEIRLRLTEARDLFSLDGQVPQSVRGYDGLIFSGRELPPTLDEYGQGVRFIVKGDPDKLQTLINQRSLQLDAA